MTTVSVADQPVLEYLARTDKWYLGGGGSTIWAPGFPVFLDKPGFWDEGYFVNFKLKPFFTVSLLNERLHEIEPTFGRRAWNPSALRQEYSAPGLSVVEEKCVLKADALVSRITIRNSSDTERTIHLIAWTCQPAERLGIGERETVRIAASGGSFLKKCYPTTMAAEETELLDEEPVDVTHAVAADCEADSFAALISENPIVTESNIPFWKLTPFPEDIAAGTLSNRNTALGIPGANLLVVRHVYIGLHFRLVVPPGGECRRTVAMALGLEADKVKARLKQVLSSDPISQSATDWNDFFAAVPHFTCSDEYLQKYYWYRWYGIHLNQISFNRDNLKYPCVFEGVNIGWFRNHISYSAQCHAREVRWLRDPAFARGSLLNFFENQAEAGNLPAKIGASDVVDYDVKIDSASIYHTDWGGAVLAVDEVHPDMAFLERAYPALCRHVEFFDKERDKQGTHLYDVMNQGETGQEYMPRYVEADPYGDMWIALNPPIKGVDASVYLYEMKRALAAMALRLGKQGEATRWTEAAGATAEAIRGKMWDAVTEMFCDLNSETLERLRAKSAVCFYPFMTDIAQAVHLGALRKHLLNPGEFWTEYPVPATSLDTEGFSAKPEWKEMRRNCPWNGRTWPMTNSHICEALARAAIEFEPALKQQAAEMIRKFIRMMFFDGDVERPNCYEHYNPHTGRPCDYRGCDDYQHSWVVDLIIKYVVGFRPAGDDAFALDPFPFGLTQCRLTGIPFRGHVVDVAWDASEGLSVEIDGATAVRQPKLERVTVNI